MLMWLFVGALALQGRTGREGLLEPSNEVSVRDVSHWEHVLSDRSASTARQVEAVGQLEILALGAIGQASQTPMEREQTSSIHVDLSLAVPVVSALTVNLAKSNSQVRQSIIESLGKIAHSSLSPSRAKSVRLLGLAPPIIETLALQVRDPDLAVRQAAAEAIKAIAEPPAWTSTVARSPVLDLGLAPRLFQVLRPLLHDRSVAIRVSAIETLGELGSDAAPEVLDLIDALKTRETALSAIDALGRVGGDAAAESLRSFLNDPEDNYRRRATAALGLIGPPAGKALPTLISNLRSGRDKGNEDVGIRAVAAIGDAKTVVPLLAERADQAYLQETIISAIGRYGPTASSATVPVLIRVLESREVRPNRRPGATDATWLEGCRTLRALGVAARSAAPILRRHITDVNESRTGQVASAVTLAAIDPPSTGWVLSRLLSMLGFSDGARIAEAMVDISRTAAAANIYSAIPSLLDAARQLRQTPSRFGTYEQEGAEIERSVEILVLSERLNLFTKSVRLFKEHWRVMVAPLAYLSLGCLWWLMAWLCPLKLYRLWVFTESIHARSLPSWLANISIDGLLLLRMFSHSSVVMDAVLRAIAPSIQEGFDKKRVVADRQIYVRLPLIVDGHVDPLPGPHLLALFGGDKARSTVVVEGDGGSGKTTIAIQLAGYLFTESDDILGHPALPILLERDVLQSLATGEGLLRRAVSAEIARCAAPLRTSPGMLDSLIDAGRLIVVVDGLSEMSEEVRADVRNASDTSMKLLVTSRRQEALAPTTVIKPTRVDRDRLSSFFEAYLAAMGVKDRFSDQSFFEALTLFVEIIGKSEPTVLLAKLFADYLCSVDQSEADRVPRSIPELILCYLNELNRPVADGRLRDTDIHAATRALGWACVHRRHQPDSIRRSVANAAIGQSGGAVILDYLQDKLQIVRTVGPALSHIMFVLDPVAEFMAAQWAIETYRESEDMWREFLVSASDKAGKPIRTAGFLKAVIACAEAARAEVLVPPFVLERLAVCVREEEGIGTTSESVLSGSSGPLPQTT
jgi:hypothetical protein